ncbi:MULTISPECIES: TIGR02677 family protein [Psychrilyobacter]|uniref:TIGR02677 family protein n=1 Tax=Psychrilyobacter piezotolerans TaxID=2293438 RepID=A0ABX9KI20_9FUSO|nr:MULTISPECIES: TIGR02677 family protein [Psychrilyobacter]MCS5420943.1 TIGR02677 family protein [Psychrilyobacter sp. S5]NDI77650.1 TIGR02677 family protein [Psychrilyobacter piezotolerans]RDE62658.1 TIGR02677 family protein [Psychrilyobacter sp. S5]REI41588.1 TIGR02677 family protein [Psychrilyobacter piezotolerans]
MKNDFGTMKGFSEFDYLGSVGRGGYYRNIIRIMYLDLERKEYLFSHEIAEKMESIYSDYDEETCNEDLEFLFKKGSVVKYKNDYSQIKSLEELRKKKYRYQLTERGRLIEEFILNKLNKVNSLSTTLDPNLLIRFKDELKGLLEFHGGEDDIHSKWNNIIYAFNLLRENYKGYLMELNSFEYEKMMEEDRFLLKKARLREYLEDFIKVLLDETQDIVTIIVTLEKTNRVEEILNTAINREFKKRELTGDVQYSQIKKNYINQYNRLKSWFLSVDGEPSEVDFLNKATINIIQKITKMAKMFLDKKKVSYSRKDSYLRVAELLLDTNDIEKVKEISSIIFGNFNIRHLKADYPQQVEVLKIEDSPNITMMMKPIKERKKTKVSYQIKDRTNEKLKSLIIEEKKKQNEVKNLERYIDNDTLTLDSLPVVTTDIKNTIINLIKTGLTKVYEEKKISLKGDKLYYEYGKARYHVFLFKLFRPEDENERTILKTFDGNYDAPNFRIEFIREEED